MFELPDLPYPHNALEPAISAETLRIHHGRHHAKYFETVNSLTADRGVAAGSLEEVIRHAALAGERPLFNNAAQAWNHAFYWASMTPRFAAPQGELASAIRETFGDLNGVREAFVAEAVRHFGSGWAWLGLEDGRLCVFSTHDGDTAVTRNVTPLLVCDLWEHAYYLDYQNARASYVGAWWDRLANWDFALAQFRAGRGVGAAWRYPTAAAPREAERAESSSPACFAGEAPAAYMGFADAAELASELNVLLEAERAGARVGATLAAQADGSPFERVARAIHGDEVHWCRALLEALTRLGATPSDKVGEFYEKAMAIPDLRDRLAFVNRGQAWVVRRLDKLLPRVRDDGLHAVLADMRRAHEANIAWTDAELSEPPN